MPAALSLIPVGMLFGVLAARSDWAWWEVLLVGLLGFTGSGQFAALPLSEGGAGFFTLLLVTASINSRYVPMALTTVDRLPDRALNRACGAHMLGDEAYACERDDDGPSVVLRIRLIIFLAWVLAGVLGAWLSRVLPTAWLGDDLNLAFPARAVLLYLAVSQLKSRIGSLQHARQVGLMRIAFVVAGASGLILLLGPVYFWVPGVLLATWLLGRSRS
ncbi:MAG: branched-chain amino acid permease [Pseudomonas sp. CO183]|nr:MAG: branched-chain amino acid permease [Pseudomonas sp. CO183]